MAGDTTVVEWSDGHVDFETEGGVSVAEKTRAVRKAVECSSIQITRL